MSDIYTDVNSQLHEWSRPEELPDILPEKIIDFAGHKPKDKERSTQELSAIEVNTNENMMSINEFSYKDLSPALTVTTFVIFVGILSYLLLRYKKGSRFLTTSDTQKMKICQTLSLGPKRHLILLSLGENEIILGNHENGMNFLFDNSQKNLIKTSLTNNKLGVLNDTIDSISEKKVSKNEVASNLTEKSKFPKYLADSFEKEKLKVNKPEETNTEHVENITNMIRQKLKDMKKIS